MTRTHGQLHEFDACMKRAVTAYLERMELYVEANDVSDDLSYSVTLGPIKMYGLLQRPSGPESSQGEDSLRL